MKKGNFFYLKNTSLSEYYTDIIKAQCASDKYPMITKILLRKIVEDIVRKVAKKYGIYSKENMRNLITSIKYNFNICFPEQICKCINTIRFNGINKENYDIENAKIFNSTDLLKMANRIFIWYIKDIEKVSDFNEDDAVIILPNNLDLSKEELEKTIDDIVSKENQINALRERVIDLANNSQNVSGLNRVVIAIKEEKALLEEKKEYLSEEIKIYEDSILDIESSYESEMKELNTLRSEWDKIQTLISEKEDKLVKVEINNQDFKMLASNFEGNKDEIIKYELLINESLDKLRKGYKNLSILCKEYKDILATITFSYKDEYKNDLIGKESRTRININKEDKLFEEEMIIYFNNIDEANKNVRVLKKILNDQITKQIKYYEFYKGFLNLRGNSLKRLYVLSNKFSVQSILINTAKNIFGIPDKEGIDEYINKKIEEISDVSDAEIKLHIYYRLINIAKVEVKCVCNRKGFTENLDNIVQKAHEFLKSREWVKGYSDYLKAISIYYLQRITNNIKSNYYNNQIVMQSNLIDDIFNNIKKFNEEEKKYIYQGLNVLVVDEINIRNSISSDIFRFINVLCSMDSKFAYALACGLLFKLYYSNNDLGLEAIITNGSLLKEFLEKRVIVDLFISEGGLSLNKFEAKQEALLPLFVFMVTCADKIIEEFTDLESYNEISDFWILKQQQYNDLIIYEKKSQMSLIKLVNEKKKLELDTEKNSKDYIVMSNKYVKDLDKFKKNVLSSDKIKYLPSYLNYTNLIAQKEEHDQTIDEMKEKLGAIKSAMSTGIWKAQNAKYVNDANINNVEKLLIEEAKRSMHFKNEYQEIIHLQNTIDGINDLTLELKESLKIQEKELKDTKEKLEECRKQIQVIKNIYPDMEASYWV